MVLVMVVMVVATEGRGVACLYRKDPNESALLACICVKVGVLLEPIDFLRCVCGIGISLVSKPFESLKALSLVLVGAVSFPSHFANILSPAGKIT